MALSLKARKRWALVILLIGMPAWIILAVNIVDWISPWNMAIQFVVFVTLGLVWVLPFKFIFKGIGAADQEDN